LTRRQAVIVAASDVPRDQVARAVTDRIGRVGTARDRLGRKVEIAGLIVGWVWRAKLIPGSVGLASSTGTKYFHWIWWPAGLGWSQSEVEVQVVVLAPLGAGRGLPPVKSPVWKWLRLKIGTLSSMSAAVGKMSLMW
jgi:hypothetical protein